MGAERTLSEAGTGSPQQAHAATLRLPPWWWQRLRWGGGGRGGGSGPRDFLGLMGSTHLDELTPNSQGVASPTNGVNRRG